MVVELAGIWAGLLSVVVGRDGLVLLVSAEKHTWKTEGSF